MGNLYNGEGTRIGLTNLIMYAQKEGDNIKLTGYKRFYFDGPWGGKRSCQSELLNLDYLEGFTFEMLTSIGSASMFEFAKDGKTYSESMDQCTSFSDWQEMIQDVKSADLQLSTWVKDLRDYFTTEYSVNVKLDDSTDDTTVPGIKLLKSVSATQSSTGWNGDPMRAIDGNTNGNYWAHSCMHSHGSKDNWWMTTLAQNSAVSKVVIHNREDCCSERINGAKVYVGDVFCGDAVGETVKVVQNDQYLTLCEVQVLGVPSDDTPLVNIAPGFPTWQSSEGYSGAPSRATDGRSNGNFADGACSLSESIDYNMWKVDLIDKYEISRVVIHNRLDCCSDGIDGVQVFVNNKLCGAVEYKAGVDVYTVDCADQVGSVIKITQENKNLTLCEVEVLARFTEKEGKLINVASSGVATQDSTGWEGIASRAIDGSLSGLYFEGKTCSHNGDLVDGWWNLEFPEPTAINKVVIYNREDCCQDRIDGVKIYADGELCGKINYVEGQNVYKKSCSSDTTEYRIATNLRIEAAEGTYLTLCEVKVLSDPI